MTTPLKKVLKNIYPKATAFNINRVIKSIEIAGKLTPGEIKLLGLRFGLLSEGDNPKPLGEIADIMGVSLKKVKELEFEARAHLYIISGGL